MLHLALSLFPGCISSVYILHISCRLLPTCIGSFHVFFICHMCPLPSCICSFYFYSICNVCLFSTCILLSHFFCTCHVCLFQICMFQFHLFCFVSRFFSRCKHPRTSCEEMRQCLKKVYIYMYVGITILFKYLALLLKKVLLKKGSLFWSFTV